MLASVWAKVGAGALILALLATVIKLADSNGANRARKACAEAQTAQIAQINRDNARAQRRLSEERDRALGIAEQARADLSTSARQSDRIISRIRSADSTPCMPGEDALILFGKK